MRILSLESVTVLDAFTGKRVKRMYSRELSIVLCCMNEKLKMLNHGRAECIFHKMSKKNCILIKSVSLYDILRPMFV